MLMLDRSAQWLRHLLNRLNGALRLAAKSRLNGTSNAGLASRPSKAMPDGAGEMPWS